MAKADVIVLGAGIVGTSVALHLAKRDLTVALIDRQGPGEATSYGNAGIIEANTVFPPAFPRGLVRLARIAAKQGTEADYHISFLPRVVPWLMSFWVATQPARLVQWALLVRPLFASAIAEHESLMQEANAESYLRKTGWLKLLRDPAAISGLQREFDIAAELGIKFEPLDVAGARALEPSLSPVFAQAVFWPGAVSITDPLALTRAYATLFAAVGGQMLKGDGRTLARNGTRWDVQTAEGTVQADHAVVALGPWAPDVLEPLGLKLPLAVKRGYHRHFQPQEGAKLYRPVLDADVGYLLAPMQQGIRITTGAEFAARDAPPTPAQLQRLLPHARGLFQLGEAVDERTWVGSRPCFPDSRPVIGRAPEQDNLWLAFGHAHWGLTLGPATGRLLAEMLTGATPFIDPAPYRAERFFI